MEITGQDRADAESAWAKRYAQREGQIERAAAATEAKVGQLVLDAHAKYVEAMREPNEPNRAYYAGFEDGLKRALNVIQGKG